MGSWLFQLGSVTCRSRIPGIGQASFKTCTTIQPPFVSVAYVPLAAIMSRLM